MAIPARYTSRELTHMGPYTIKEKPSGDKSYFVVVDANDKEVGVPTTAAEYCESELRKLNAAHKAGADGVLDILERMARGESLVSPEEERIKSILVAFKVLS
jgi:hypothetical protein